MALLLVVVVIVTLVHYSWSYVLTTTKDGFIEISNNYIILRYSIDDNTIDYISSDFHGIRNFTRNILAKSFQLSVHREPNNSSNSRGDDKYKDFDVEGHYQWLVRTELEASLKVTGIVDNPVDPIAEEDWVITLKDNQRSFSVAISGNTASSSTHLMTCTYVYVV